MKKKKINDFVCIYKIERERNLGKSEKEKLFSSCWKVCGAGMFFKDHSEGTIYGRLSFLKAKGKKSVAN